MSKPRPDAIPGFRPIAPAIWEYIPTLPWDLLPRRQRFDVPSSIILFSWTGAQGKHILKYTMTYQTLFPTTPILVITTSHKDFWLRSSARKQTNLQPAIDRLLSYKNNTNILTHVFSEGGSNKAVEFADAYYDATSTRLPYTALCLDSTPGHPHYRRLCNAFKKSLPPNPILNATSLFFCGVILGATWVFYGCFKGFDNNLISKTRRRIVDPQTWDLSAPRCYLYSRSDELIAWQDVREHALEAVEKGIPVMEVCFEESAHCKHAPENPDRYWDAVAMTWKRASKRKEEKRRWGNIGGEVFNRLEVVVVKEGWREPASQHVLWDDARIGVAI